MLFHRLFCAVPILFLIVVNVGAQYSVSLPDRDVTMTPVNGIATFKGAPVAGEPGQPLLPVYTVTFLLPSNVDFLTVKVSLENLSEKELDGAFDVKPALPPSTRGEIVWPAGRTIIDGKDVDVYGRNAFTPSDFKGSVKFGAMRNYKLAQVTVYPYKYNPVTRKLRMITGGMIVLTTPGTSGATVQKAPSSTASESTVEKWLRSTIVNPQALQGYGIPAQSRSLQSPAASAAGETYAIITTNSIVGSSSELANLVALKQQKGFNVITVTENTWGGGTGDAAANNIRNWLQNNYLNQNISYVLLIGDPNPSSGDVPMKMCWPRYSSSDYPNAPTDFYYADLTGNWDINNNGYCGDYGDFCTTGGPDRFAEVAVGRIPCYGSMATLDKIIEKIIRYENETAVEWRRSVMLPMVESDNITPGYQLGEQIRTDILVPKSMNSHRLYNPVNSYTFAINEDVLNLNPPTENAECSEIRVLNAWKNNSFGLVTWWSHGSSTNAVDVFSNSNAANLDDQHPSIVFQVSCENAWPEDSTNLAYTLLSNGAVTTIAATRVSWYKPGEQTFSGSPTNAGLAYSFAQNLVRDSMDVASALNLVKSSIIFNSSGQEWWMNWLDFNVYGCPDEALCLKPSVVAAPTGLTTTAVSENRIDLSWNDQSNNESGFRIERAIREGDFTEIASVGANVTSYQNNGLSTGTKYQYRVRAYTNAENSLFSNVSSAFTDGSSINPPSSITIQQADSGKLQLSWNGITGATAYNIWASGTNGGPYVLLYPEYGSVTSHLFTLTPGNTYYFAVSTAVQDEESPYSAQVSAMVPVVTPVNLTATAQSATGILLNWSNPITSIGLSGEIFEIEYATTGDFTLFSTTTYATTSFNATGLIPSTTYQFRVRAKAKKGTLYSDYTNSATATTLDSIPNPCALVQGGGNGLQGTTFGLNPPWAAGSEYCKATDGDSNTFYDAAQADSAYTGLDFGTGVDIGKIRFYPRAGFASRMVGGKFQISIYGINQGWINLYTITTTPEVGWNDVTVSNPMPYGMLYRYVRYVAPDGGYGNIAEMEFYQAQAQSPYNGPHNITNDATLQVEDFDNGGEGVSYHDDDTSNTGGAYRTGVGVDIENCGAGGYDVGWTNANEWMEYTCNVTGGTYNITLHASSPNSGTQTVKLYQDDALKATFSVPNTGGWQTYQAITLSGVQLSTNSASVLKIESTTGGYNLDKITFATAITQYTITASAGSNGSISPSGSVVVNSGASQTFTITPDNGYEVDAVTVDGTSQGPVTSYAFSNVSANHTISATFKSAGVFPDPNKWYKIATRSSADQCLDVTGGSYANNTAIELWQKVNVNQEFRFQSAGNGYYTITCRGNTDYSIDMGGNFANSQTLKLWTTDVNNANQKFKPVELTGGYYRLETSDPDYSIDNTGNTSDGVRPILWTSSDTNINQQWIITEVQ